VDAIDYAIYRYLSRDGLIRFWASRRIIDPRVSSREIAAQVGVSEAGVRLRLRHLRDHGLLRSTEVRLNPSLFGASIVVGEIPVRSPKDSEQLFRDLSVVDGMVFARDLLDEEDRTVHAYFISDSPAATARRASLLRRLAPAGAMRGPHPYWIPACPRSPSPLDWRLLAAFRRRPDGSLAQFATDAHVSLKTAATRFGQLLDAGACWWSHGNDTEEWPLALLRVTVEASADPIALSGPLARLIDPWMPVAPDGLGNDPEGSAKTLAGLVPIDRPAALEGVVRRILSFPGVENVRRTFGLGSATYPQWVDEQLAARLSRT